jgi:hypothetical protein
MATKCSVSRCRSRAAVELITFRNEARGIFCRRHGALALKQMEASEKAYFAAGAPGLRG